MLKPLLRKLALIFIFVFSGLLIYWGHDGMEIKTVPAQYVGYFFGGYGLFGLFGFNIWRSGPLDMRND